MMRPIERLKDDPEVEVAQHDNLRSAWALAALLTEDGSQDVEFYKNIVSIPHYQTYSNLFKLVDPEDPEMLVTEKLEEFKNLYDPIVKANFDSSFSIENGVFTKDKSSSVTKYLLSNLNDNVHQNLFNVVSPLKYDTEKKFHKKVMDRKEMYEGIDESISKLNHEEMTKKLHRSLDKILLAHKHSKIFLLLMSGPVLITIYVIKYAIKILIFYYLFKKKKPKTVEQVDVKSESEAASQVEGKVSPQS